MCVKCKSKEAAKGRKICSKCKYEKEKKRDPFGLAYRRLKAHAKFRGKEFDLTKDQFKEFCVKSKYHCGSGREKDSLHVDRIDESRGYTFDNIQALTNSENVKKYVKWIGRDRDGINQFRTEKIQVHDFSNVPF